MKRQLIIDMVPQTYGGDVVYVSGLGAVSTTVTNLQAVSSTLNAATGALPTKPVTYQTDFSKVANNIASIAGTVAAVAAVIPGGQIVAVVAGVVAAACLLLGKLFGNSKAKALAAERAQYETAIAQLQYENLELDNQYTQTYNAVQQMRQMISGISGVDHGGGLGLCIFNCKKNEEEAKLDAAKAEYNQLNQLFEEKSKALMHQVDEFNKLMREYNSLLQDSQTKDIALYAILGLAALGAGIAIFSSSKK